MKTFKEFVDYLDGMNIAHALILAIVLKALCLDISLNTVLLTIPLLGYEGYKLFLKSKKPDPIVINNELTRELDQVKAKLSALTMDKNVKPSTTRYF